MMYHPDVHSIRVIVSPWASAAAGDSVFELRHGHNQRVDAPDTPSWEWHSHSIQHSRHVVIFARFQIGQYHESVLQSTWASS